MIERGAEHRHFAVTKPAGDVAPITPRALAIEAPIAVEYNGIGYAVMMATPIDLEDFAVGFSLSEGLIRSAADLLSVDAHDSSQGWILRITLSAGDIAPVVERARQRVSESSCGLCGIENLEAAMRPLPQVTARLEVEDAAVFRALDALYARQPLNRATGAAHAAAFCSVSGDIIELREDVGRHNALDKLLGALARQQQSPETGFLLLTARCSYELVQKAVLANCPMLVTISAPTTLAVDCAQQHRLQLLCLARPDAFLRMAEG